MMDNRMIFKANICYLNNVFRATIGCVEYPENTLVEDIIDDVYKCLQSNNHPVMQDGTFYIIINDQREELTKCLSMPNYDTDIIYSEVVAPENSFNYAREEGVSFFFHTNERNHKFSPHIHAGYNGNEIMIFLYKKEGKPVINGSLHNNDKEKCACEFVEKHIHELRKIWKEIIADV